MSKTPSVPGTDRPAEKAAGHWLLAQQGKKVLRPGGRETTNWLLARALGGNIDVVEFAPGLGITALEIVKRSPKSYTGVDLDPKAAEIVTERIGASTKPNYRVVNASAQETGLPSESYDAVVGEAMLTMQTDKHKLEIMREAARLLRPGGYYAIHEMSLVPDYLRPRAEGRDSEGFGAHYPCERPPADCCRVDCAGGRGWLRGAGCVPDRYGSVGAEASAG